MNLYTLADDRVELWLAPVAPAYPALRLASYENLLDDEERARWQRFHFAEDRQRFLVGRAFMRSVLASYLGNDAPATLRFARLEHGKPVLAGADAGRLHFNLSHTGTMLVLAVNRVYAVGVDVETLTREVELLALAQRYFSAHEYATLEALEPAAQREHFFALWTLKEAWLKARGLGLRIPLDTFSFNFAGADPAIEFGPRLDERAADWQFRLLARDAFRVALAVHCAAARPLRVAIHEWLA